MTGSTLMPVTGPSVWHGRDLAGEAGVAHRLTAAHLAELDHALADAKARGLAYRDLDRATFPLPGLSDLLGNVERELRSGRGFALLSGFPVERYRLDDVEMLYYGLCAQIGQPLTQNSDANLIHYVTDGARRPNQGTRGVGLPKESHLHVDLTDVVSLLCVRQAPDAPPSRVASSGWVYNALLDRDPAGVARLCEGYQWSRRGEQQPWETPNSGYLVPLFSVEGGQVSCRYNRNWIEAARDEAGPFVADADRALFDLFDAAAFEARFEFPFGAGDIQFCNNLTVLHGRAGHLPIEDEAEKRLLLRVWLDLDDFHDTADPAIVRYGVGRHGLIGFTPAEMAAGRHRTPRPRRRDGAFAG